MDNAVPVLHREGSSTTDSQVEFNKALSGVAADEDVTFLEIAFAGNSRPALTRTTLNSCALEVHVHKVLLDSYTCGASAYDIGGLAKIAEVANITSGLARIYTVRRDAIEIIISKCAC